MPEAGFRLELIRGKVEERECADAGADDGWISPLGVRVGLLRVQPDVVVGVGGYASGSAMMAAILLRVPTLAFEPNAVPGLANRLVGRWEAPRR